jgi:hypothetical protein
MAMDIKGPMDLTEKGNRYILVMGEYSTRYMIEAAMEIWSIVYATLFNEYGKKVKKRGSGNENNITKEQRKINMK